MLIESFSQSILKWLRIPQGSMVRKAGVQGALNGITDNDYIQTILDITVDDICVGDSPLSIECDMRTSDEVRVILQQFCDEFNSVVKDIARDLCVSGFSIVDLVIDKDTNKLLVFPYLDEVEFYLTKDKKVVAYDVLSSEQVMRKLIFINYDKVSLQKVDAKFSAEKSDVLFKIIPSPMQLKNVQKTIEGIQNAETAIAKYRALLRPLRYANVDIGTAQGDVQKATVDSIASAINANSDSLGNGAVYTDFDDNIPVLPNRKGLGMVTLSSDIPSADITSLSDLEYWLNKLNLLMRFPGTYMDFSKALNESAVSLIRGDLRYTKLCKSVQSKIISTLNAFLSESKFACYSPQFFLTSLPSSEDDNVMQALMNYCELASTVDEFVLGQGEDSKDLQLHRLKLLKDLYNSSTSSPMLQKWFNDFEDYINSVDLEEELSGDDFGGELGFGGSRSERSNFGGGIDFGVSDEGSGDIGEVDGVEAVPDIEFNPEA